mgnify:CR=1 FL=1
MKNFFHFSQVPMGKYCSFFTFSAFASYLLFFSVTSMFFALFSPELITLFACKQRQTHLVIFSSFVLNAVFATVIVVASTNSTQAASNQL